MAIRVAQVMGKMENGGVESVVMNYYRHINRDKIQFDFIVDNDSTCPQESEIIDLGGRVYRIAPYQHIKDNMNDLERIFRKNKYKIVHSHLTTMSVFSLAVAKKCGVPVRICHGHNTAAPGEGKKNIMKYMLRPFSKIFATHYFACSEYAGKWLFGEKAFKSGKVTILRNAIDLKEFQFSQEYRDAVRKELGIENKFVIGHIGRFVYQKNHEFLLEIFGEILKIRPDSVLLLIGEGPLEENIKQKAKEFPKGTIKFLGIRNDTYRLYSAFDVFCLPSRYEGLPVVGVEAQANGLPCVFSDAMTREVKLLETVTFLNINEPAKTWAMIPMKKRLENAGEIIRSSGFDISSQAQKLEKLYEKLFTKSSTS